jgi:catechol 2,3-dioxygenase-like lactoylglutathione lyase family enzyme
MAHRLGLFALVVRDYDDAIRFFVDKLGFTLLEDTDRSSEYAGKRWVRIAPPARAGDASAAAILLAKAVTPEQLASVGNQTGGRVFIFLETDDFWRDYEVFQSRGVVFVRPPREESYGMVAVFEDLYGNKWDLIEPRQAT